MNPQNSPTPSTPAGGTGTDYGTTESSGTLTETKNKITQTARDAASKVKAAASNTAARAREEAARLASEKKEATVGKIGSYSSAIHETARSLEEKDPNIAWFTHQAADKLQGIADYMRNRDFTALRHDCEDVARRHPAVFFGGMFLAGLILGNIVKASGNKLRESEGYSRDDADWENASTDEGLDPGTLTEAERSAAGI
jgi:hypothetical protein